MARDKQRDALQTIFSFFLGEARVGQVRARAEGGSRRRARRRDRGR
jgi:hypothetical protein